MSTPRDLDRRALSLVSGWLLSLPHDLKVLVEAKDDPNLEREAREIAAGAILFTLGADRAKETEFAEFADDAILLRAALRAIRAKGGEGAADFAARFSEHFDTLDEDLALVESTFGELYVWIAGKIDGIAKQSYKNKKVPAYIDDDESTGELYEDFLAFQTDFPLDEDKLAMRLKKLETLLEPLRRKLAEEKRKIG